MLAPLSRLVTMVPIQRCLLPASLASRIENVGSPAHPYCSVAFNSLQSAALKLKDICGSVLPAWAPHPLHRPLHLGTMGFSSTEGCRHHLSLFPVWFLASHLLKDERPLQFLNPSRIFLVSVSDPSPDQVTVTHTHTHTLDICEVYKP